MAIELHKWYLISCPPQFSSLVVNAIGGTDEIKSWLWLWQGAIGIHVQFTDAESSKGFEQRLTSQIRESMDGVQHLPRLMVASDFRFMMVEITHVATPHYREANIYGWMPTDAWAFFVDLDEGSEGKR